MRIESMRYEVPLIGTVEFRRVKVMLEIGHDPSLVIAVEKVNFSRFRNNPVIMLCHRWDIPPIGVLAELDESDFSGIPMYHCLTDESMTTARMAAEGVIFKLYPGGAWDGNIFKVYEISIAL